MNQIRPPASPSATPHDAARVVAARSAGLVPRAGLILGSGLAHLAEAIAEPVVIDYADLPGFPLPSVEGHVGRLVLGRLGGLPVACLLFAFADAAQIRLQGVSLPYVGQVPVQAIQALPYLLTVLLLAGFVGRARAPKASGIPFVKDR